MSFTDTLIRGEQGLFKSDSLTPMQKITLRFVVVGLILYGFAVVEGMIMRLYEVRPLPFVSEELVGGIGMGAFMGMAGLQGMLRRSLYVEGEFRVYMILAGLSGALLLLAFLAFFANIVMSLGLRGVVGIFTRPRLETADLVPAA